MFPITLSMTINSKAELDALQSAIAVSLGAKPAEAKTEKEAPNAEAASKAADKVAAETEKKVEKLQEQKPDTAGGEKTYTIDDAKQLTNKVVAVGKRDEMVALLKEFGVPVSAKLTADQIEPFCKKAEALL